METVKRVLRPQIWLNVWAGIFIIFPLCLGILPPGGEVREASEEWDDCVGVAAVYETLWAVFLMMFGGFALGFANLFVGPARAKLAMLFALVMLAMFVPTLAWVNDRYDTSRSWVLVLLMALFFALIGVSGLLHLRDEDDGTGVRAPLVEAPASAP